MVSNNGKVQKEEADEIFNKCYLCGRWWWQSTMKHVRVPDQDGHVRKYVCMECFRDVNDRSYQVLAKQK
jgi:hypothetical protein